MPRIQWNDALVEAGRFYLLLAATWAQMYLAVLAGFVAFVLSGIAVHGQFCQTSCLWFLAWCLCCLLGGSCSFTGCHLCTLGGRPSKLLVQASSSFSELWMIVRRKGSGSFG